MNNVAKKEISGGSAWGGDIDTAWLYGLSNLQNLALHVYHDGDHDVGLCMAFDDKLTRLNNLQHLLAAADTGCAIHFCVPWHLMTALHSVDFQVSVGITGDISDLLQASRLKTITYTSAIEDSEIVTYAPEAFVRPWKELEQYIQLHCPTFECQFVFHYWLKRCFPLYFFFLTCDKAREMQWSMY